MRRIVQLGIVWLSTGMVACHASQWDEFAGAPNVARMPSDAPPLDRRATQEILERSYASESPWMFRAEALAVWRSQPQSLLLFQDWNQPLQEYGDAALDANQFNSPMAAGPRFTLLWEPDGGHAFEASFLRIQSFSSAQSRPFVSTGYAVAETTTLYGNTWTALDRIDARLNSSLQSAELLGRRSTSIDWLTLTGGFRWVEWAEDLDIVTPYRFGTPPLALEDRYATDVTNSLYGLQIGLDAERATAGNRFRLRGVAKAGVYGNDASQESRYVTNDPEFAYAGEVATGVIRTAFVGEVGATLCWNVTEGFAATIGYSAFWLGGLATAPEQLPGQTLVDDEPIVGSTSTGGSVVVQGLTLGLEAHW